MENDLIATLKQAGFSQNKTLQMIGLSKGSYQYRAKPRPRVQNPIPHWERPHPAALTAAEDEKLVRLLRGSEVSVAETFYRHLDDGEYIASMSSFHRRARREKIPMAATGRRRRRKAKDREVAPTPVLAATGPGQVVCWDISFLPGPYRSTSFALYLIIDLFSRLIVGWSIQERENKLVAAELMDQVLTAAGSILTVHSDNGGAMTSTTMAKILSKHNAAQSLIRPGVSNDNAQIESLFRTVKYGPTWPGAFTDIQHANTWFAQFVEDYNTQHHHTGLAGFTPAQVHDGSWQHVARRRQATLDAAFLANPGRYRNRPHIPTPPDRASLNLGHDDGKTHTPPTLLELLAG